MTVLPHPFTHWKTAATGLSRVARSLSVVALLAGGFQAPLVEAGPPLEFIDVHVHLVGGRGGSADYDGAVRSALEQMSRSGIRTAIVMPPPQIASQNWYDY
ncbi:MAG: hypothetical protein VYD25_14160 [Pseudomonadota bacterium]|nr:hypothetical protein [Pseudomonadota bacterium]